MGDKCQHHLRFLPCCKRRQRLNMVEGAAPRSERCVELGEGIAFAEAPDGDDDDRQDADDRNSGNARPAEQSGRRSPRAAESLTD